MANATWELPIFELLDMLFQQPMRLIFTISFMSRLDGSTSELSSSLALYFNSNKLYYSDGEERQVVRDFLNRLNHIKLAACPSGFYTIKPAIFLTLLSLVVTYLIILLQSNGDYIKSLDQKNITSGIDPN